MKRVFALSLAMVMTLSCLTACGDKTGGNSAPGNGTASSAPGQSTYEKDTLVVATTKETTALITFYPGLGTPGSNITVQYNESLVRRNAEGTLEPWLATSWTLADDLTWDFILREDVVWHNGEKFNADDVIFTWNVITEEGTELSNAADITDNVQNIEKTGEYSFRITTKKPYSGLLLKLTAYRCFEETYFNEVGLEGYMEKPIGTGPWKFVNWNKDVEMNFDAFEDYWGGAPKIPHMKIVPISAIASRVAALEAGDVDIISGVPSTDIERLKSGGYTLLGGPTTRTCYVGMNCTGAGANPALRDIRVREALNRAVDVDLIIESVLDGYGKKTSDCTFNESYTGFRSDLSRPEYDVQKAKELLAEAGYGNGLELTMSYVPGAFMNDSEVAQVIVAMLAEVGVTVTLSEIESGVKNQQLLDDTITDLHLESMGGPQADGDLMYEVAFSKDGRYSTYNNPEMDALHAAAKATMDEKECAQAWGKLQEYETKEMPGIALYQVYDIAATNSHLKNWTPRADQFIDTQSTYFE
ncbi:MAG: ABC transporter substrate-binding protein [Lawsonibacter sp.]|jgi:peptide/nickel transport system substrate-binding protein|nr:ABC transporter substrate-binding protein [Lawsonibacter sp.]